jgi:hypothetical protein
MGPGHVARGVWMVGRLPLLCDLFGVQFSAPASVAAASARSGESVARAGDNELALQLGSTDSIPNIVRPSAVLVSIPC